MHLDDIKIALYYEKKLQNFEKEKVEEHLANCSECSENFSELVKFYSSSEEPKINLDKRIIAEAKSFIQPVQKTLQPKFTLALVCFFAVLILTTFYFFQKESSISVFRTEGIESSPLKLNSENESTITSSNLNFSWRSVEKSIAYRFQLHSDDGTLILEKLVFQNSLSIPSDSIFVSGKKYLWRVEIIYPDNSKERSNLNVFTYKK